MYSMSALYSVGVQSGHMARGGMAFRPLVALCTRPSMPLASKRGFHAAASWTLGALRIPAL